MARDIGTPEFYESRILSFEKNIEVFEKRIRDAKKRIEEYKLLKLQSENLYKHFKYKCGSAVFHKEKGNCLVKSLTTKRFARHYEIIDKNGDFSIVEESSLLPITEMIETLYTK